MSETGRATDKMVKGQNVWVQRTGDGILVHVDVNLAKATPHVPVEQAVALEDADIGQQVKVITKPEMLAGK